MTKFQLKLPKINYNMVENKGIEPFWISSVQARRPPQAVPFPIKTLDGFYEFHHRHKNHNPIRYMKYQSHHCHLTFQFHDI